MSLNKSHSMNSRKRSHEIDNDENYDTFQLAKKPWIEISAIIEERNTCAPVLFRHCKTFGKVLAQSPDICEYCKVPTGSWTRKNCHKIPKNQLLYLNFSGIDYETATIGYRIDLNQAVFEENW